MLILPQSVLQKEGDLKETRLVGEEVSTPELTRDKKQLCHRRSQILLESQSAHRHERQTLWSINTGYIKALATLYIALLAGIRDQPHVQGESRA